LLARSVPFWVKVQVPGPVMADPVLVMRKVPFAARSQVPVSEKVGGTRVGVAVGDWQKVEAVAIPTLPPPEALRSKVPYSPEVLIVVDWPAVN
jgi:hypothetical protein